MTVVELIEKLTEYQKEIGGDCNRIASHDSASYVKFVIEDESIDLDITLARIDLEFRPGCCCPDGISFILRKDL